MKNVNDYINEEKKLLDLEYDLIDNIVKFRKEKGISGRKLCKMINMKQPYLVKIENKKVSPSLNTILKIINALDLEIKITKN